MTSRSWGGCSTSTSARALATAPRRPHRRGEPAVRTELEARGEGVAGVGVAGLVARGEPRRPLLRRAVGERLLAGGAARHAGEAVVADGGGRVEPLLELAGLEDAATVRRRRPHARVAVGLQLERHRELVRLPRSCLLTLPHLVERAREVLEVVPDLVGDHVRLRQVAGGAVMEAQVVV